MILNVKRDLQLRVIFTPNWTRTMQVKLTFFSEMLNVSAQRASRQHTNMQTHTYIIEPNWQAAKREKITRQRAGHLTDRLAEMTCLDGSAIQYNSKSISLRVNKFEEIQQQLLKTGKAVIQHLSEMMLFLNYCIFSDSAEALVRCCGKQQHLLIAYFLGNTCAKHYENSTMLSRVTAKNVGDVFLRHIVEQATGIWPEVQLPGMLNNLCQD